MGAKVYGTFLIIFFILLGIFALSFQYIAVSDSDNETSVENSTRNSMTEAVNLGNARVNEEVTINENVAIEATVRNYANSNDFYKGNRQLNVYRVLSDPALIAAESYMSVDTPMQGMLNRFSKDSKSNETITRSREITIFEAKKTSKP